MENEIENIIIRMPNWIGDFVMATALFKDIKTKYPKSKVTLFAKEPLNDLVKFDKNIDEVISFKKENISKEIKKLKKNKYDLGILLTNSFSSAWYFYRANIKTKIGYGCNLRSFFLNKKVEGFKNRKSFHQITVYKKIIKDLGMDFSEDKPKLHLDAHEMQLAKKILLKKGYIEGKKLIGINMSAAYGSSKCWPKEKFKQIAKILLENENNYVVFIGDNKSKDLINEICLDLPNRAINLAGKTNLRELMSIINLFDVFLTNDSGPMHIAAALDVFMVALFGSTSYVYTGPLSDNAVVINKTVSCSPCFKRQCPIDFKCMKEIKVLEVLGKIYKQLNYHAKKNT